MYSFIKDNFTNSSLFVSKVLKSGTLTMSLSDKKVLSMNGFCELLGIDLSTKEKTYPKHYHLDDIIPQEYFQIKKGKLDGFYELSKANSSRDIMISYALNTQKIGSLIFPNLLVNIKLSRVQDIAYIRLTNSDASGLINDKILLVSYINNNGSNSIVYATHLHTDNCISLINHEYEILCLLAKGYSSEKISYLLCISRYSVDDYRKSLIEKFKAHNTLQLIYNAFKEGYI
jgi:DNA-binding CsgD family transcriptional regulator